MIHLIIDGQSHGACHGVI